MFVSQVTLYHLLKLFQSDSNAMPKKTVVSEFYDEMVFFFFSIIYFRWLAKLGIWLLSVSHKILIVTKTLTV